ncbi:MAG: ATP-dependent DNA helicase [bacterium]|nr:ATP-dependent DNA helicase [bacterium]
MLNKNQQEAVEYGRGPLLIIAGAGTGKTTVLTERIKHLIGAGLAKPEEILALTFTEKAAREMEERIDKILPYGVFGMWVTTFHSFCDRILRSEALHIGLSSNYKLMTEAETYLFVKKNFWQFELKYFRPHGNPYKFIEGMIQHFSRLKDEDISPDEYRNDEYPELVAAYKVYEKLKIDNGVMDFADLITNTLKLFRERKNILQRYQKQFKYILLDEFQDTNFAQYQLVKLLCADDCNVTVVADDDQSIYRFRGAAISNVLQFKKDYLPAGRQAQNLKVVTLNENYRSTQEILDRSYDLIQHNNPDRLEVAEKIDKKLVAQVKNNNEIIEFIYTDRVENEAEEVVKRIKGRDWKDFAILVRANNHAEPFVRALERAGIPYQFLGPGQLFKQPEVRDLIAYLKFLIDFTDSVSLYRVLSMEIFNFKQREIIALLVRAKKENLSLFEIMEKDGGVFVEMVHKHQELINKETAGQILYYFLEDSGLLKSLVDYKTAADEKRALNIMKFFDKLKSFEGQNLDANVFAVSEYLALAMDQGESPAASETDWTQNNAVNILTLHSAKGLEFPVVFLVNLVEGRFPTRERKEQIPIPDNLIKETLPVGDYHLEEERRLFYVGMTRAKEKLYLSAANFYGEGKRERKASPFVNEAIGDKFQKIVSDETQLPLFEWQKPKEREEEKSNIKVDYLSYSSIETFRMCPLHYKLKNILRIPTPPNAAQSMGNSMHLMLRDLYLNKLSVDELLKNDWIHEGYQSKKHEEDSLDRIKKFLEEYLKTDLHKNAKPLYLEQPFMFKVDDLKIGGKFDRVDDLGNGEVEIIDYKTGANVPSKREIDVNLQMTIYALAAATQFPIEKIKLSFYYFDTASKITTIRTKEQLEEAKKGLLAIRDEIQQSNFQCSGSIICQNCEFKILCN